MVCCMANFMKGHKANIKVCSALQVLPEER